MQPTKILLALFVVLTVGFAALSVFEYDHSSGAGSTVLETTTQVSTTTTTLTSTAPQSLPTIVVGGTTFTYTQWNSSTPDSFTISGVKFALWTNTTVTYSGGSCYGAGGYGGYIITFPGGSSETMTTCTVGLNPPTIVRLSSHVDPQAGLLIYPSTGAVFFLVSSPPPGGTDTISLDGFSIATTGVVQPTPYLSGDIYVNAAPGVTWSSYTLYTNGTDCGTRPLGTSTTMNNFAYFFQGAPCGPITTGSTYLITFTVTFTDGTNATASASVLAD